MKTIIKFFLILILSFVSFFLPFGSYNLGYPTNEKISLFSNLNALAKSRNPLYINQTFDVITILFAILFLISVILIIVFLIFSIVCKKKFFDFLITLPLFLNFLLIVIYPLFVTVRYGVLNIPSWSFYLSLLTLVAWGAYIFSPKWLPLAKKQLSSFKAKHPTKTEQIAELESRVKDLEDKPKD